MRFLLGAKRFLLIALLVYVLLKVYFLSGLANDYIQQVVIYSFVVILVSLGLNIIYGFTGQFSLGHAAFYGIGAYSSAYVTSALGIDGPFLFLPALVIGGVSAAGVGYLVGAPILRLRDDFLAIATLGFGILVKVVLDNSDRLSERLGGARGFLGIQQITNLEITLAVVVFLVIVSKNLINSRYGLFWRCIKGDELASEACGIDTGRTKLMAFTYGCFLAGIGGGLYSHLYPFLHPSNFDFLKSIDFLIIVIVGGMGSITGTLWAGLIWVAFIEGLRVALPSQVLELRWVLIPILLILLMMWKPTGLMAEKESKLLGLEKP